MKNPKYQFNTPLFVLVGRKVVRVEIDQILQCSSIPEPEYSYGLKMITGDDDYHDLVEIDEWSEDDIFATKEDLLKSL